MSVRNLEALFGPASVAVIGASRRPGSLGAVVLKNLREGGFDGPVWAVNARHRGRGPEVWPDVRSLPDVPDLAVICTPAPGVPALIDELGRKGTRAAIVISAGLKERGPDGRTLEQAMLDAARPYLLRILGPNCIGALVPGIGLNASFAPAPARPGPLAFVTQSGALATAMLDWANARGLGFSHFVSLGDSADVDFGDMLDYLGSDPATRAILMYVESVREARKFMSAARAASRNKPVILVKAGRDAAGAKAAASHTGALAGSDAVFDAAVRRAGMLRVGTLEALFDAAETLARVRHWRGQRLAILTNGGGAGVLAADELGSAVLAELSAGTVAALDRCLPATWSRGNPVDIIGDAPVQRYLDALRVLLDAPEVDGVLFIHAPTAIVPADDIAAACLPLIRQAGKPVLTCWLGGVAVAQARLSYAREGVASYNTPERAADAWLQLAHYHRNQQALLQLPAAAPPEVPSDTAAARQILDAALRAGAQWLDEGDAKAVLEAFGLPVVPTVLVRDADQAVAAAERIGYPVVVKVVSPQVVHKSDVGGVALDLHDGDEVRNAIARMRERLAAVQVTGFTVQAMVRRPGAHELIVGIAGDDVFGPTVLFGEGGTAVELRRDRAVGLPPLNAPLAEELIDRTHVSALLAGYRGRPAVDRAALVDALQKVSRMAAELPALAELDINPLLADASGVLVLDARIRLRHVAPGQPSRLALRPYPAELEQAIERDGRALLLRPIRPEDGARLADFYADASPADLRLRFFMSRREVPRSELARFCQIDYEREMTFIVLDGDRMVAEVRAIADPDNRQAEFALMVAGAWQCHGLGRLLMERLMDYLRSRGTGRIVGECLRDNAAMAALARSLGFDVAAGPSEDTLSLRKKLA